MLAIDSGSSGPGSNPGIWAIHFILTAPLSTHEYKWVRANCLGNLTKMLEGYVRWINIPFGGIRILLVALAMDTYG